MDCETCHRTMTDSTPRDGYTLHYCDVCKETVLEIDTNDPRLKVTMTVPPEQREHLVAICGGWLDEAMKEALSDAVHDRDIRESP